MQFIEECSKNFKQSMKEQGMEETEGFVISGRKLREGLKKSARRIPDFQELELLTHIASRITETRSNLHEETSSGSTGGAEAAVVDTEADDALRADSLLVDEIRGGRC